MGAAIRVDARVELLLPEAGRIALGKAAAIIGVTLEALLVLAAGELERIAAGIGEAAPAAVHIAGLEAGAAARRGQLRTGWHVGAANQQEAEACARPPEKASLRLSRRCETA